MKKYCRDIVCLPPNFSSVKTILRNFANFRTTVQHFFTSHFESNNIWRQSIRFYCDGATSFDLKNIPITFYESSPKINICDAPLPFSNIPGPKGLPFIGSRLYYKPFVPILPLGSWEENRAHVANMEKFESYGRLVKEKNGIFSPHCVLVFNPRDVQKIFQQEGSCPYRPSFQALGECRQGKDWMQLRKLVQKNMMSLNAAIPYSHLQGSSTDDLVDLIRHSRSYDNSSIDDFIVYLQKWSLEATMAALLGKRLGCLKFGNNERISEADQLISDTCLIFDAQYKLLTGLPWWKLFATPTWNNLIESHDRIFYVCQRYTLNLLDALQKDSDPHAYKSSFAALLAKTENLRLDDLLTTIIELMISGIQTTASALAFTLYHLALHPNVQTKLRQEIKDSLKDGQRETFQFRTMPYLRAVLWETARLNPVAFGTVRVLDHPIELSGYNIPGGTPLIIQNMVLSRIPSLFKDHDKFIPERWLKHGMEKEFHPYCVLPYGHGPRMCIGRRFAEQELNLGIIKLLANFKISYEMEPIDSLTELIVKPDRPLTFKFMDYDHV